MALALPVGGKVSRGVHLTEVGVVVFVVMERGGCYAEGYRGLRACMDR